MNNPWNVSKPFDDMFVDGIVLSCQSGQLSCDACVFPVEDVDPFTESTTTSDLKQINVLVRHKDLDNSTISRPKISDVVKYSGNNWQIAVVESEQTWYRILARRK